MKHRNLTLLGATSALALSLLVIGCERTVSETEKTKVDSDGTVQTKEKKVTESPDGTVTRTEEKKTVNPDNP